MSELPLNQIVHGNAFSVLPGFPVESVNMVMFSPPYWSLRYYKLPPVIFGGEHDCQHEWETKERKLHNGRGDSQKAVMYSEQATVRDQIISDAICSKCGAWMGSLGLEPHPQLFIEHIVLLCQLLKRVLKKSGSLWLNMGDSYYGGLENNSNWLQSKQKLLIPERVALAMQEDGWILRNDIIWHKPNHMPSSVKDRFTNSWEHLYFFVKSKHYHFDLDSVRQPHKTDTPRARYDFRRMQKGRTVFKGIHAGEKTVLNSFVAGHPLGRNPDDTVTYRGKFEGFGQESELYGSPRARNERKTIDEIKDRIGDAHTGEATANLFKSHKIYHDLGKNPSDAFFGEPPTNWDKMEYDSDGKNPGDTFRNKTSDESFRLSSVRQPPEPEEQHAFHELGKNMGDFWSINTMPFRQAHFAVYPEALCMNPIKAACPKNGVVLDPLCGAGTTLVVARKLLRNYVGIELNPKYIEIAKRRLNQIPIRLDQIG